MLFTNHVVTGALVGRLTRRPAAAAVLGVASHAAQDALPHWGVRAALRSPEILRVAVPDGLVGLALAAAILRTARPEHRWPIAAGILGAGLPDADKPCTLFFGRSPYPRAVDRLHARIQNEAPHRMHVEVRWAMAATAAVIATARWPRPPRSTARARPPAPSSRRPWSPGSAGRS